MIKLRVSEFHKRFPSFPYYRPGDIYSGRIIMPFSVFGQHGDPKVFYLDAEGILPEFQLIAYRDNNDDTRGIQFCAARIPALHSTPPHLFLL